MNDMIRKPGPPTRIWRDELVASDHDTAGVDYLKKFRERVRLVQGEEDGEVVTSDLVPDVTYCLRRHADGRWLLLAVNNRRGARDGEIFTYS